jgi:DNA helicase-2/ATP-dependent DNA helicase PcrA
VPDLEVVLAGLNDAQRQAALALRGPVAILAGAGTGKTTTITHRIACQVRSGAFEPSQILAVTFTDKAAAELRARLGALGVEGVEARTFHSAALSQLSRLWSSHTGEPLPEVLDHKAPLIASLANALPPPHKFLPRRELAGEIEWAKNRMIPPARYLAELDDHEPPIPAELMLRVYDGYERRKTSMGRLDFEDMLGLALRLFDEHPEAAREVRSRFAAFNVDEFQERAARGPARRGIMTAAAGCPQVPRARPPRKGTFSGEQADERFRPTRDDDSSTRSRVALNSH